MNLSTRMSSFQEVYGQEAFMAYYLWSMVGRWGRSLGFVASNYQTFAWTSSLVVKGKRTRDFSLEDTGVVLN